MRVVAVRAHGGLEQVQLDDWPMPEPGPGMALVEVRACGLNYLDIFVRRGMPDLPVTLPRIPGGDVAGVVCAVGDGVDAGWVGQRVALFPRMPQGGILGEHANGGACEFMTVDHRQLHAIPGGVDFNAAAALPIAYGTAHRMLVTRGKVQPGEKLLILGASGGVGTACVQIGKMLGAEVFACTSGEDKAARLKRLGADHVINYARDDFAKTSFDLSGRTGMNVAINFTGGDSWIPTTRAMAREGRILTCGSTAGHDCRIDVRYIWHREIVIIGSRGYMPSDLDTVLQAVSAGRFAPVIDRVLPLEQAREAMRVLEDREVFGKVILNP
jgi:alcohol dehydrogenase